MWLFLAILIWPWVSGGAGNSTIDRATLRGLKALSVVIDPPDPEMEGAGIRKEELQTRIEERLGKAGVPVDNKAVEFLGLRVKWERANKGPFAVSVALGLYQPVVLVRDRGIRTATETWATDTVLLVERRLLIRSSMSAVDQLVDEFIDAFRSNRSQ